MQERLIGLDGRFPRTLIEAFKDPGAMSLAFVAGNRRRYIGPVGFFFIMLTVYLLVSEAMGVDMKEAMMTNGTQPNSKNIEEQKAIIEELSILYAEYFKVVSFFSVLIVGILVWLFNRKMKLNLIEHMVFAFYVDGIIYLMSIAQLFAYKFNNGIATTLIFSLILTIFSVYAYLSYDKRGSLGMRILRGTLIRLISFIVVGIIVLVLVFVYAVQNPALFKPGA